VTGDELAIAKELSLCAGSLHRGTKAKAMTQAKIDRGLRSQPIANSLPIMRCAADGVAFLGEADRD